MSTSQHYMYHVVHRRASDAAAAAPVCGHGADTRVDTPPKAMKRHPSWPLIHAPTLSRSRLPYHCLLSLPLPTSADEQPLKDVSPVTARSAAPSMGFPAGFMPFPMMPPMVAPWQSVMMPGMAPPFYPFHAMSGFHPADIMKAQMQQAQAHAHAHAAASHHAASRAAKAAKAAGSSNSLPPSASAATTPAVADATAPAVVARKHAHATS